MTHVDVETLVSSCVGGNTDRKVNCETLAKGDEGEHLPVVVDFAVADVPPDFPPESFWLSKDAELDWFDRNAFFERKESGKGISNSTNLGANLCSNSNSLQFSKKLKCKSSLFGLPTTQKTNYLDSKRRNNKPAHLFPKRSESTGKSSVAVIEPSSPKVSCIGRVRSKRSRRKSGEYVKNRKQSAEKSRTGGKKGFCSRILSIFKVNSGCANRKTGRPEDEIVKDLIVEKEARKSTALRMREISVGIEAVAEPPMLGGMKKLASGRRSGSDTTDDFDVVPSIQVEKLGVPQDGVDEISRDIAFGLEGKPALSVEIFALI